MNVAEASNNQPLLTIIECKKKFSEKGKSLFSLFQQHFAFLQMNEKFNIFEYKIKRASESYAGAALMFREKVRQTAMTEQNQEVLLQNHREFYQKEIEELHDDISVLCSATLQVLNEGYELEFKTKRQQRILELVDLVCATIIQQRTEFYTNPKV